MSRSMLEIIAAKGMHESCKAAKNSLAAKLNPTVYQATRQNFIAHCERKAISKDDPQYPIKYMYSAFSEACKYCSQPNPVCSKVDEILNNLEEKEKKLEY